MLHAERWNKRLKRRKNVPRGALEQDEKKSGLVNKNHFCFYKKVCDELQQISSGCYL
jgi:hypothetical protein